MNIKEAKLAESFGLKLTAQGQAKLTETRQADGVTFDIAMEKIEEQRRLADHYADIEKIRAEMDLFFRPRIRRISRKIFPA